MTGNVNEYSVLQSIAWNVNTNISPHCRKLCVVSKRGDVPPAVNFQTLLFQLAWAKCSKKHPAIHWYAHSWCNGIWSCLPLRSCFTKQEDGHVDEMLIPVTDNHLPSYQDKHHVNNYCTVACMVHEQVMCIPCYRLRIAFWLYLIPLWTGHMQ